MAVKRNEESIQAKENIMDKEELQKETKLKVMEKSLQG